MPEVSHVSVPLWAVCLYVIAFASLAFWLLLELITRPRRRPMPLEQVEAILDEAEADCPPSNGVTWQARANELDAQRVYWKNTFISFVKRGL